MTQSRKDAKKKYDYKIFAPLQLCVFAFVLFQAHKKICVLMCLLFCAPVMSLTLAEKVGQVMMVHFHGEEANEEARILIQELCVGGIIYYNWSNGLTSPEQIRHLSQGLQALALHPLLIAVDQEGGKVSRLKEGFTQSPGNFALGETGNPETAKSYALQSGREMKAVGINLNLAPVVDIHTGSRSFGNTAEKVSQFAQAALTGYHDAEIMTCLKHFPGLGGVQVDPHFALPVLQKTKEELFSLELLPFQELASQTEAIMLAHLLVPPLDPLFCATLSPTIIALLRNEIGFQGVILTDSLVMKGLENNAVSLEEAAIQALRAGCDMLLLGGRLLSESNEGLETTLPKIEKIHAAILEAVQEGRLSEQRLDEAVHRILVLKKRFLLQ